MALQKEELDKVGAIILAGGQGTRLFPLTQTRCKPAVSFGGHYRLIDIPISNALNSQIENIFVICQYFASDLQQHLLATYHMDLFRTGRLEMLCPEETPQKQAWFKGTADAVRHNLDHLLKFPFEYFLILSGDQLYNIDLRLMITFAKEMDTDLTIASLPVLESEAKRMGLLKIDASSYVTDFVEKPTDLHILEAFQLSKKFLNANGQDASFPHYLGSMGIYVFKREAIISLLKEKGDDFGKELIPMQVKRGKTAAFHYPGYWEDIGTIGSFYKANLLLITKKNCLNTYDERHPIYSRPFHLPSPFVGNTLVQNAYISQGSIIEAQEITHSIIGVRSLIKKGTIIRDSIIMGNPEVSENPPPLVIGENCLIEKAIIDEQALVGNNVHLVNKDRHIKYDGDGIYIRDGIIIVTSGTKIPDGFKF